MNKTRTVCGGVVAAALVMAGVTVAPAMTALPGYDWNAENVAWYAPKDGQVPVYRVYDPTHNVHHYTVSVEERDALAGKGWRAEGVAFNTAASGIPVYRLYDPHGNQHLWTTSAEERDSLVRVGWNDEHIGWYAADEGVPVLRVYNPGTEEHLWTTNSVEYEALTGVQAPLSHDELLAQAKAEVQVRQQALTQAQADLAAKQKTLNDLRNQQGQSYSADAIGYFRYTGSTDAVTLLTDPTVNDMVPYIHPGGERDATNLDNMIHSARLMVEANELRASEGLPALEVSDSMVALTISYVDWSLGTNSWRHRYLSGWSAQAQNAAFGYLDPFDAWYREEKQNYLSGQGETGHYETLTDKQFDGTLKVRITGLAWANGTSYQDFIRSKSGLGGSNQPLGRVSSADEYLNSLLAFKAQYGNQTGNGLSDQIRQAEQDVQAAQTAVQAAQTALDAAQQRVKDLES